MLIKLFAFSEYPFKCHAFSFYIILESGSAAYDEFLHFIGDVIKLRGHKNYRGGLNVTDDETGTHSVYTTFRRFEIMFHVCTFLPFQERDAQRVERKRHIGNDVVVLVFKDRKDETDYFNPDSLTSHFNSIQLLFVIYIFIYLFELHLSVAILPFI